MNFTGEIIIIFLLCMCSFFLGILGGKYETGKQFCEQKNGIYVDSYNGWICIKGEQI